MANNYNINPIAVDTVMASGWRALQTLNTGSMPTGYAASRVTTSPAQRGLVVSKVIWEGPVAAGHAFVIVDPNNTSVVLLSGQAGTDLSDQLYDNTTTGFQWRDFEVTQIDSGTLRIYYR